MKTPCLDCGAILLSSKYLDNLIGKYTVCPNCDLMHHVYQILCSKCKKIHFNTPLDCKKK